MLAEIRKTSTGIAILVICPKCGMIGRLRVIRKSKIFGWRKFAIYHEDGRICKITWIDGEDWDKLNVIYETYRR